MGGYGVQGHFHVLVRLGQTHAPGLLQADPGGDVAVEGIVGAGLVGDHVGYEAGLEHGRQHLGAVAAQPDGQRFLLRRRRAGHGDGLGHVLAGHVQVLGVQAALDAVAVHLHDEGHAAVHGDGQGLGATHASQPPGEHDAPGQGAVEVTVGQGGEGLVGALQDALGADVDPGAGRHLAVHHQALLIQLVEVSPVVPMAHQVGVGYQHPGGIGVGLEHPHRFAGLHQHGLVVFQLQQGAHQGVEAIPVARRLADAAVDHQLIGVFAVGRVQVVAQHPQGRFLEPALAVQLIAHGRLHRSRLTAPDGQLLHETLFGGLLHLRIPSF